MNGKDVRIGAGLLVDNIENMVRFYRFPTGETITYPFGIRNFYIADPEGNLLEIGSTNET
ncbi:VOC family protein [Lacrimispora sp.]|uniref:VOC family protein n=1 Tax=Lacrimispora sp. TaxID=2719234 RepID=UPI00346005A0